MPRYFIYIHIPRETIQTFLLFSCPLYIYPPLEAQIRTTNNEQFWRCGMFINYYYSKPTKSCYMWHVVITERTLRQPLGLKIHQVPFWHCCQAAGWLAIGQALCVVYNPAVHVAYLLRACAAVICCILYSAVCLQTWELHAKFGEAAPLYRYIYILIHISYIHILPLQHLSLLLTLLFLLRAAHQLPHMRLHPLRQPTRLLQDIVPCTEV